MEEAAANLDVEMYPLNSKNEVDDEGSKLEHGKSALKHKKVLIIDDDIRNVYALTIALEQYQMDIIVAENGREGIEMLQGNPDTDLILMDIMMPEMDGFEAILQNSTNTKVKNITYYCAYSEGDETKSRRMLRSRSN